VPEELPSTQPQYEYPTGTPLHVVEPCKLTPTEFVHAWILPVGVAKLTMPTAAITRNRKMQIIFCMAELYPPRRREVNIASCEFLANIPRGVVKAKLIACISFEL